jgi:hypothetical protein
VDIIPTLFGEIYPGMFLAKVAACASATSPQEAREAIQLLGSTAAAYDASAYAYDAAAAANIADAANIAYAADAATYAADAAADAAYAANIANIAAYDAYDADKYLLMSANIALEILIELKSPGCELL